MVRAYTRGHAVRGENPQGRVASRRSTRSSGIEDAEEISLTETVFSRVSRSGNVQLIPRVEIKIKDEVKVETAIKVTGKSRRINSPGISRLIY